jgi:hypothetical protein
MGLLQGGEADRTGVQCKVPGALLAALGSRLLTHALIARMRRLAG